jgi:hypothetical protein
MLQLDLKTYASDVLEEAMRLAQTKALNSYTFSDCLIYLNYAWMNIYQSIVQIDEGYYSRTVKLTSKLTKMPPFLKNTIRIYAAQGPVGFNREIFRASGYNDLESYSTYHISGFDLYCPDAIRRNVWLNYIPMQQQLFFTHHNRDPKIYDEFNRIYNTRYNLYDIVTTPAVLNGINVLIDCKLKHRDPLITTQLDLMPILNRGDDWDIIYLSGDFPYIFVTYKHKLTGEYYSGFFKDMINTAEWIEYNPFAFTGRNSDVEYLKIGWSDKTGMGVVILDHSDNVIKELGWTPDSLVVYPSPEVYRYLVAQLADKFSALNESNVMGVQKELVEARYAFFNFLKKDKSSWTRIDNVNGPTIADLL